eukprot:scaffold11855_cov61-Phaeocystis_antarctica.AAC.3
MVSASAAASIVRKGTAVPFRPSESHRGSCHSVTSAAEASEAGRAPALPTAAPKPSSSCRREADGSLVVEPACGGRLGRWSAEHSSGRNCRHHDRNIGANRARVCFVTNSFFLSATRQVSLSCGCFYQHHTGAEA